MGRHRNTLRIFASALAAAVLSACSGGGGGGGTGGGGGSVLPPVPHTAPPPLSMMHLGLALFGDDSHSSGFLQIVSLYDSSGKIRATPVLATLPFPFMYDYEDMSIAPNASYGLVADGARTLRVLSGISSGHPAVSNYTLDASKYGTDLDAVRVLPNGDEAIVAADTSNSLTVVSGLLSGKPQFAQSIPTPDLRNGLAVSADGKVLLARGYSGVTVYSIADSAPAQGPLGGWSYHSFTQTLNLTSMPSLDAADARAGMALSPADSTRGVVVGAGAQIAFLSGLPAAANVHTLAINGASNAYAVAISADGTQAFVGTDTGVAVFSGVNTSSPAQTQTLTIRTGTGDTLNQITTLGITSDGAYLVVAGHSTLAPSGTGYLAVLPLGGGALGAPVGLLSGVYVPDNDQMVVQ